MGYLNSTSSEIQICRTCFAPQNGEVCNECRQQENNKYFLSFSEVFWDTIGEHVTFDEKKYSAFGFLLINSNFRFGLIYIDCIYGR